MRAAKIFVITVGSDSSGELQKGAKALFRRLQMGGHAASVSLVHVSKYTNGRIEHKYALGDAEDKEALANEADVGVYIVGHHGREISGVGDYTPEQLARALIAMGFRHIRKLCILACRIAGDDEVRKHLSNYEKGMKTVAYQEKAGNTQLAQQGQTKADTAQENLQRTYLGDLSKQLAGAGMMPKIAGWDSFVTICYGKNPIAKEPEVAQHMKLALAENKGRKVVAPNAYGKQAHYYAATPKEGEEPAPVGKTNKVIIQWHGDAQAGKVVAITQEGWSDKNRLMQ